MKKTLANKEESVVYMKSVTWQKDSHSLFDYEFNKNVIQDTFEFTLLHKFVFIYRNNSSKFYCNIASKISV